MYCQRAPCGGPRCLGHVDRAFRCLEASEGRPLEPELLDVYDASAPPVSRRMEEQQRITGPSQESEPVPYQTRQFSTSVVKDASHVGAFHQNTRASRSALSGRSVLSDRELDRFFHPRASTARARVHSRAAQRHDGKTHGQTCCCRGDPCSLLDSAHVNMECTQHCPLRQSRTAPTCDH